MPWLLNRTTGKKIMKRRIYACFRAILFVTLISFASGFAYASVGANTENPVNSFRAEVYRTSQNDAFWFAISCQNSPVKVVVLDSERRVIYTDTIKKAEAYYRKYNLSALPLGVYTVEFNNGSETINKTINLLTTSVK